jgi:hypothetical protein
MNDKFDEKIIAFLRKENKCVCVVPDRVNILLHLHNLFMITGKADSLFCNSFMDESIELLKNAVFLYEDGYFDCAFYSVRQAYETINCMMYLAVDPINMANWENKARFPMNKELKERLGKISFAYHDVKCLIPEYFAKCDEMTAKANKIIHKQGLILFIEQEKRAQINR